jgi:hypothetical protein
MKVGLFGGSFDPIHHWRADKPGFVPYVLITGFGSPAGMSKTAENSAPVGLVLG